MRITDASYGSSCMTKGGTEIEKPVNIEIIEVQGC
jgi:hypothetical protein